MLQTYNFNSFVRLVSTDLGESKVEDFKFLFGWDLIGHWDAGLLICLSNFCGLMF